MPNRFCIYLRSLFSSYVCCGCFFIYSWHRRDSIAMCVCEQLCLNILNASNVNIEKLRVAIIKLTQISYWFYGIQVVVFSSLR